MAFTSIGYDGTINERQWAELAGSIGAANYGIKEADDLKVSAVAGQPLMVSVAAGTAWGQGVMDTEAANTTLTCDTISSGARWDLIALRRDWQPSAGGPSALVVVKGSATKAIPTARQQVPGVQDDQPIALVQWTAGQTQPTAIIDLRVWAGNGGAVAVDELVLTYLKVPGASLTINGIQWDCTVGANDMVSWIKSSELGKVPLFSVGDSLVGGKPADGTHFLISAGTVVATTDASGYARAIFPKPFPGGLVSIVLTNGDDWASGAAYINLAGRVDTFGQAGLGSKTEFVYALEGPNATGTATVKLTRRLHRLNYIAIGW